MALRLKPGKSTYGASFARNAGAYKKANSAFGKVKSKVRGGVSGGTPGRTGRTAGNAAYGAFKAKRTLGQVGHAAGKIAGSTAGRVILTAGSQMAIAGVTQRRNSNKARAKGYTERQIRAAHNSASRKGKGYGSIMAGSYMAQAGGQLVGRGKKSSLIGAGLLAGGSALTYHGTKKYNEATNQALAKQKPGGKARVAGGKARGQGMSRSQAASIAAKARWAGRTGRR
jgi:hypothetical protein